jgi:hypothetical protein
MKIDRNALGYATLLCGLLLGCGGVSASDVSAESEEGESEVGVATEGLGVTSGYGRYCSITWSDKSWAAMPVPNVTESACDLVRATYGSGGTARKAGMYSLTGTNFAMIRCDGGYLKQARGVGTIPAQDAVNVAVSDGATNCILTISPRDLPIFDSPVKLTSDGKWPSNNMETHSGFDHAQKAFDPVSTSLFGDTTPEDAMILNNRAQPRPSTNIDNHGSYDFAMPKGTELRAVADGEVIFAQEIDVTNNSCKRDPNETPTNQNRQLEVFIKHTVKSGTSSTWYAEVFISRYAHLSSFDPALTLGAITRGTVIGKSGSTGCSTGPHLHFGVYRVTNTTSQRIYDFDPLSSSDREATRIDPYGWQSPLGHDPWPYLAYPDGAYSVNLWRSLQAPPTDDW